MTTAQATVAGALTLSAAVIVALGVRGRTAVEVSPGAGRTAGFADYLAAWRAAHLVAATDPLPGGRVTLTWLRGVHRLAAPLTRRGVSPDLVTAASLWLAVVAGWVASLGAGWAALAGVLTLLAGVGDGLDGAVALLGRGPTPRGFVLDAVADRLAEVALVAGPVVLVVRAAGPLAAHWAIGAGIACVLASWLLEYVRARAQVARPERVGALVTPGERPTRIILLGVAGLVVGACQLAAPPVPRAASAACYPAAFCLITLTALLGAGELLRAVGTGEDRSGAP